MKNKKNNTDKTGFARCICSGNPWFTEGKIYPVVNYIDSKRIAVKSNNGSTVHTLINGAIFKFEVAYFDDFKNQQDNLEWPQKNEKYWYIDENGNIQSSEWVNSEEDNRRRDSFMIYKNIDKATGSKKLIERLKDIYSSNRYKKFA